MYNYFLFSQSGKKFQENKITTTTTKSSKKTNSNKEPNKKNRRLDMFVMIL